MGYLDHKHRLSKVLSDMSARGIPISREKQREVAEWVAGEIERLNAELQALVPPSLKPLHPAQGYKVLQAGMKKLVERLDAGEVVRVSAPKVGTLVRKDFAVGEAVVSRPVVLIDFNALSADHVKAYLKLKGYKIPVKYGTDKETTGKKEMERVRAKHPNDRILQLVDELRGLGKQASNYCGTVVKDKEGNVVEIKGPWVPGEDGRVHPWFDFGTAIQQLVAKDPPAQTFPEHGPLAKKVKSIIVAEPGYTFVKMDMRGYHPRILAWLSRDPVYYRLTALDVHTYVTAHFMGHPLRYKLLDMNDTDLAAALKEIRGPEDGRVEFIRNYQVKRAVNGIGNGLMENKLYAQNSEYFANVGEAKRLLDLLRSLFPRVFQFHASEISLATRQTFLTSKYGHIRHFYDTRPGVQSEEVKAYKLSNAGHCHIQDAMLRLDAGGWAAYFEMINMIHDCLVFHPPTWSLEGCIMACKAEMEQPSTVLVDPTGQWPPFTCAVDVSVGPSWDRMEKIKA